MITRTSRTGIRSDTHEGNASLTDNCGRPCSDIAFVVFASEFKGETKAEPRFNTVIQPSLAATNAPSKPALGSMYVFLPNGTLLESSCVETYRIATWTIDKASPTVLRVTEDNQLAFTADILDLSNNSLRLKQTLVRSKETRNLAFKAVEHEFVCPDLPKR